MQIDSIGLNKSRYQVNIFLFLHENICCGYSLEAPRRGASNEHHTICFRGEIRTISIVWIEKNALSRVFKCTDSDHPAHVQCIIWAFVLHSYIL